MLTARATPPRDDFASSIRGEEPERSRALARSDHSEMALVERRDLDRSEPFAERHERRIGESDSEIVVLIRDSSGRLRRVVPPFDDVGAGTEIGPPGALRGHPSSGAREMVDLREDERGGDKRWIRGLVPRNHPLMVGVRTVEEGEDHRRIRDDHVPKPVSAR